MTDRDQRRPGRPWNSVAWSVLLVHGLASVGLVAHHVRAESSSLLQDGISDIVLARILSGPVHWTTMDRMVFGILIVMAMELLNWIVRHSGGAYGCGRAADWDSHTPQISLRIE